MNRAKKASILVAPFLEQNGSKQQYEQRKIIVKYQERLNILVGLRNMQYELLNIALMINGKVNETPRVESEDKIVLDLRVFLETSCIFDKERKRVRDRMQKIQTSSTTMLPQQQRRNNLYSQIELVDVLEERVMKHLQLLYDHEYQHRQLIASYENTVRDLIKLQIAKDQIEVLVSHQVMLEEVLHQLAEQDWTMYEVHMKVNSLFKQLSAYEHLLSRDLRQQVETCRSRTRSIGNNEHLSSLYKSSLKAFEEFKDMSVSYLNEEGRYSIDTVGEYKDTVEQSIHNMHSWIVVLLNTVYIDEDGSGVEVPSDFFPKKVRHPIQPVVFRAAANVMIPAEQQDKIGCCKFLQDSK